MSAPTIPIITSPVTGTTKHYYGTDPISVICTIEDVPQIVFVYIAGVEKWNYYSASGATVTIPNVQLGAGSNVITAKAMNLASELSDASDSVTVTGVNTQVTSDIDILSYIETYFIAWAKANATITALLAGAESIAYEKCSEEVYPALILSGLNSDDAPLLSSKSAQSVSFSVTVKTKDLYSMESGGFANPDISGTLKGASYIANVVRTEIFEHYPSFIGAICDLRETGKSAGTNDDEIMEYTINFSGLYLKPKGRYE